VPKQRARKAKSANPSPASPDFASDERAEWIVAHHTLRTRRPTGPLARNTPRKQRIILERLKDGCTVEDLFFCIDGVVMNDFLMGRDSSNNFESHYEMESIFKTTERVLRHAQSARDAQEARRIKESPPLRLVSPRTDLVGPTHAHLEILTKNPVGKGSTYQPGDPVVKRRP
jgi:hypothetical protein